MEALNNVIPIIRSREEILSEIQSDPALQEMYNSWPVERRKEFLDICTGARGHRILNDVYFKYIFDPENDQENLKNLLSALLDREILSMEVLNHDSALVNDRNPLMIMDILVRLEDGTIVNVEIQKIGLKFPGQRAACYSADLLLRQYQKYRSDEKTIYYDDLKNVYTIVLIEDSPAVFGVYQDYIHHFQQISNTGLELPLLQEYFFIPLDIFRRTIQDKSMEERTALEAWLTFLTAEDPAEICEFIRAFPEFGEIYRKLYGMYNNIRGAMSMFSEQLRIMDENTINLMIDEMREELEKNKEMLQQKDEEIAKHIKNVMTAMNVDASRAMEILEVPEAERQKYLERLK